MTQHRPATTPNGDKLAARPLSRAFDPARVDVTDIIPFNEFGDLHDLDFREHTVFEYRDLRALSLLPHDHDPINTLAPGKELCLG